MKKALELIDEKKCENLVRMLCKETNTSGNETEELVAATKAARGGDRSPGTLMQLAGLAAKAQKLDKNAALSLLRNVAG